MARGDRWPRTAALGVGLVLLALPRPLRAEPVTHAGYDYYFGDLHAHTGLSLDGGSGDLSCPWGDTCGDYATVLADARQIYGLDFLALTDHGNGVHAVPDPADWSTQLEDVLAADDPAGGFVTIPGVEVWLWHGDGEIRDHRNLYLFGDGDELSGLTLEELIPDPDAPPFTTDDCSTIFEWLEALEASRGPALLIPHHPAFQPPGATDWQCTDPRFNPVVENYSEHGNSQTASFEGSFDSGEEAEQPDSLVDRALALEGHGLRLGLVSGTDSHDTRPGSICDLDPRFASKPNFGGGLSIVALEEGAPFDREAVLGALRARRTMASSGPRIPVAVELRVDGHPVATMGEETTVPAGAVLEMAVQFPLADAPYVTGVDLVRPELERFPMVEAEAGEYSLTLDLSPGEAAVFYARIQVDGEAYWSDTQVDCDDGGEGPEEVLWASPLWIQVDPLADDDDSAADDDDCACRLAGPARVPGLLAVPLLVVLVTARRLDSRRR